MSKMSKLDQSEQDIALSDETGSTTGSVASGESSTSSESSANSGQSNTSQDGQESISTESDRTFDSKGHDRFPEKCFELQGIPMEYLNDLRDAFTLFDKDQDGSINMRDLGFLMRTIGHNPTEAELQDMLSEFDLDGSGTVEFVEFAKMMYNKQKQLGTDEALLEAFQLFDKDQDGFIDVEEMRQIVSATGEKLTEDEFDEMIAEVDMNMDGKISWDEFRSMMLER